MSIAEFLDGMPSFDERNFSHFRSNNDQTKHLSVYITTNDPHPDQIIGNDNSHMLLQYLHKRWDRKVNQGGIKRESDDMSEEYGSTSRKRPRVD